MRTSNLVLLTHRVLGACKVPWGGEWWGQSGLGSWLDIGHPMEKVFIWYFLCLTDQPWVFTSASAFHWMMLTRGAVRIC